MARHDQSCECEREGHAHNGITELHCLTYSKGNERIEGRPFSEKSRASTLFVLGYAKQDRITAKPSALSRLRLQLLGPPPTGERGGGGEWFQVSTFT